MFANQWSKVVDQYLRVTDGVVTTLNETVAKSATKENLELHPKFLYRFTFVGLFIVCCLLMFSCQTTGARTSIPPEAVKKSPLADLRKSKKTEMLYIKRDHTSIKSKSPGSSTGSIWADAQRPRDLIGDQKPNQIGDYITVDVPNDLQFKPVAPTKADKKEDKKGDKDKAVASAPKIPDPMQVQPQIVTAFKMEVVAVEPNGDLFLRGQRSYEDQAGNKKQVLVLAKVPEKVVQGSNLNAKELTQVHLSEEGDNGPSDYIATGWDMNVSRRLSGFVPDVSAEMQTLEDTRTELAAYQKSLEERNKANQDERDRLIKDRERLGQEKARFEQAKKESAEKEAESADKKEEKK